VPKFGAFVLLQPTLKSTVYGLRDEEHKRKNVRGEETWDVSARLIEYIYECNETNRLMSGQFL